MATYVVLNDNDEIIGGPYLWDGKTEWTPPEEGTLDTLDAYKLRHPDPEPEPPVVEEPQGT